MGLTNSGSAPVRRQKSQDMVNKARGWSATEIARIAGIAKILRLKGFSIPAILAILAILAISYGG